jgi:hypothetical protein
MCVFAKIELPKSGVIFSNIGFTFFINPILQQKYQTNK